VARLRRLGSGRNRSRTQRDLGQVLRAAVWDEPRQLDVHDVLESGQHVVALGEVSFAGTDGAVRFKTVEVYHHEDGRFTERWFFVDRRQELDRLLDEIASR
jgi:hypothetical protein